ncbi:MAG TPA: D-glycero-beta-D-manno-heptose 1,7-bisphosphate 7-phosphatase [Methylomirabilota bacterium]|nr:D-glycero-beta-D-manno-heptose 1,7-bisphosphate 7-phosphatase [Methylomirabilota bacterium]
MPECASLRPAVFLDRDGTIAEEVGYLNHINRFRIFPFVAAAIRRLNEASWPVVVVSNQSGVGRGYFPESLVNDVNELMKKQLSQAGATIDAVYYCPHTSSDNCICRKPKNGMLEQAAREHSLDLRRSYVVGDRYADIQLAENAGAHGILVRTGYGEGELAWHAAEWPTQPDFVAKDLAEATDWILRQPK